MSLPGDLGTAISNDSTNGAFRPRPVRILLADDHQPMLDRVAALLSDEFTVVATVNGGREAVSAAARLHPDVLVLDISMPDLNGFEAAVRVREAGSTAAVIFLTVHHEAEFLEAAWAAGALGYVRKSHLASDLIPAIRAAIEGQRFVSSSIEHGDAS